MSAPAPLPITLEHVLLQIGVVEKQDVIVVDNKERTRGRAVCLYSEDR